MRVGLFIRLYIAKVRDVVPRREVPQHVKCSDLAAGITWVEQSLLQEQNPQSGSILKSPHLHWFVVRFDYLHRLGHGCAAVAIVLAATRSRRRSMISPSN